MGMYTQLHFAAKLRKDVPAEVVEVLRFMARGTEGAPQTPDHPLFSTERWRCLFTMDSYYFDADTRSTMRFDGVLGAWLLNVQSNVKNYDGEIEKFLDWIDPYLAKYPGDFLGYSRYEETEQPTLIFKRGERDV
jgi:hypothetical protein